MYNYLVKNNDLILTISLIRLVYYPTLNLCTYCFSFYYSHYSTATKKGEKDESEEKQPDKPTRTMTEYREQKEDERFDFEFDIRQVDKEVANSKWKGTKAIAREEEEHYFSPHYVIIEFMIVFVDFICYVA